jgi:hypothetical protein
MWPRRRHPENKDSIVLTSTRLLQGDAADLFNEPGQGVPGWARVNTLAHSDPEKLTGLNTTHADLGANGWDAVVSYLATEILCIGHRQAEEVALIQRTVLVPLELALLAGILPEPRDPAQLATLVINALQQAPIRDMHERHRSVNG